MPAALPQLGSPSGAGAYGNLARDHDDRACLQMRREPLDGALQRRQVGAIGRIDRRVERKENDIGAGDGRGQIGREREPPRTSAALNTGLMTASTQLGGRPQNTR